MARIELDLAHAYKPNPQRDEDYALLPLKMRFDDGGAYALLGPSGCGKTTLLNIVSGLVKPSQGTVKFDGVDVTARTPQQRNIAQVFQFPVIYDTMTVAENLAFPLLNRQKSQRGLTADKIRQRVGKIAEMLELSGQLNTRAAGLAADAKQKISLGRGLVREDVSAVLFDEPLTVIDPHLKWQLRRKLKQIHNELKLTLIYVTHDQVEALTFAEEVVVMTRGRAVQIGSASELFERPQHTFVGHFIGSPGMNFLPTHWSGSELSVAGQSVLADGAAAQLVGATLLGVRPEYVTLAAPNQRGAIAAVVTQAQDIGTYWLISARIGARAGGVAGGSLAGTTAADAAGGALIRARLSQEQTIPRVGESVWLGIDGPHTCFYRDEHLISPSPTGRAEATTPRRGGDAAGVSGADTGALA